MSSDHGFDHTSRTGAWFDIKISSYQYRKSRCGDKTIVRSSYLHSWISYAGKMSAFILNQPPDPCLPWGERFLLPAQFQWRKLLANPVMFPQNNSAFTHCVLVTPYGEKDLVNIGSGNGLFQKAPPPPWPLSEPILTYHQLVLREYSWYQSLRLAHKSHYQNYWRISQGPSVSSLGLGDLTENLKV